jgi:DNA-binding MarR family transcriptional regulator
MRAHAPRPDLDPAALDVGHLALFVGYAFADAVMAALGEAGFADLRFSHGFLIQHLIEGGRTIGELAQRMEMTQQGASKAVAELEALHYVERRTDDEDARVRRVQLSTRGREALAATRRARERLQRRLASRTGDKTVKDARRLLARLLDELGGTDAVSRRRVSAPR